MNQTTLKSKLRISGVGLHSGQTVSMSLQEAPENHGIRFYQSENGKIIDCVPALADYVVDSVRCTAIGKGSHSRINTIEHLMAAIFGCGLTNAKVYIEGTEVPTLDGSSLEFFKKILRVGLKKQNAPMKFMKIRRKVQWSDSANGIYASIEPSDSFEMKYTIDYPSPIGLNSKHLQTINGSVATHLGASRTFCQKSEISKLLEHGLGRGGDINNVVVVDAQNGCFLNAVRYPDECLRHKLLDAFGDLALVGMPIMGFFVGIKSGHKANVGLVKKILSDTRNYELREMDELVARIMPGADLTYSDLPQFSC
ncbi:MAG: UDP-3-O-acyl-N-acetylglucosamine deacetylase [Rhodobacteraceae bacterium]|nr:UDP-3-O-acyl-N-acetylglucosamine deacetylase [Paracoccaceae bacterium]